MSSESVAEYIDRILAEAEPEPRGPERRGQRRGEGHPNARITEDQAREILRLKGLGESVPSIEQRLGVSRGSVAGVFHGATWRHLGRAAAAEKPEES